MPSVGSAGSMANPRRIMVLRQSLWNRRVGELAAARLGRDDQAEKENRERAVVAERQAEIPGIGVLHVRRAKEIEAEPSGAVEQAVHRDVAPDGRLESVEDQVRG